MDFQNTKEKSGCLLLMRSTSYARGMNGVKDEWIKGKNLQHNVCSIVKMWTKQRDKCQEKGEESVMELTAKEPSLSGCSSSCTTSQFTHNDIEISYRNEPELL